VSFDSAARATRAMLREKLDKEASSSLTLLLLALLALLLLCGTPPLPLLPLLALPLLLLLILLSPLLEELFTSLMRLARSEIIPDRDMVPFIDLYN